VKKEKEGLKNEKKKMGRGNIGRNNITKHELRENLKRNQWKARWQNRQKTKGAASKENLPDQR